MAEETPENKVETPAAKPDPPVNPPKTEEAEKNALAYAARKQQEAEKARDDALKDKQALEAKVKEFENAQLSEQERLKKEAEDKTKAADAAEKKAARLEAIVDAELPKDLADLVPEGIDNPKEYIELRIKPLQEKMKTGAFGNPNNPPPVTIPDEAKKATDEYHRLVKQYGTHNHRDVQEFYNANRDNIMRGLSTS
jgi:chromosome segregation ATPase